jgi:hypothetical protein
MWWKEMPDVSRTEIGRRMFSLQKEKHVELAIEKIRPHLGSEWARLSQKDIEVLKHILGGAWVSIDRQTWEKIAFSRMSYGDVMDLVSIGNDSLANEIDQRTAVEKAVSIMLKTYENAL